MSGSVVRLPVCAVCGHPVETMTRVHEVMDRRWVFRAYCHGDVEECCISERVLAEITPGSWMTGEAFTVCEAKKLCAKESE